MKAVKKAFAFYDKILIIEKVVFRYAIGWY